MTTPIFHGLGEEQGASPTGTSYYESYACGCPLKKSFSLADAANFLHLNNGLTVGSIGHAFMELHFKKQLGAEVEPTVVEFGDVVNDEARLEAERLFCWFRKNFPSPDVFGKVIASELKLPMTRADARALTNEFGLDFTCKIDLVTQLTEAKMRKLLEKFNWDGDMGELRPGRWLWDFKFYAKHMKNLFEKTLGRTQYQNYIRAYNATAKEPCQGMIQIAIFKTKKPSMQLTVVPFDMMHAGAGQKLLEAGSRIASRHPLMVLPSENNCYPLYSEGPCYWMQSGCCDRNGPTSAGLEVLEKGGFDVG